MEYRLAAFIFIVPFVLSACSMWMGEPEAPPLPGERLSVMQLQKKLEPDSGVATSVFEAPAPWVNERWPQTGGYPHHAMQHLALNTGALQKVWSASIGAGISKTAPLLSQPILADSLVFTKDSKHQVSAMDATTGKVLWRVNTSARDEKGGAIGGGLAQAEGTVFVTNGYTEVLAIKAEDGAEYWRVRIPAPARAAPTVLDGRVYVTTIDNRLMALDAATGAQLWAYRGVAEATGLLGAASPAATGDLVIGAFSSGDLIALRPANGSLAWSDNLAPTLRLGGGQNLSDIRALPVVDDGLVIAISYAGRLVAIDARSGNRVWQRDIAGIETPAVVGAYVFVLTTENQMIALARATGAIRWVVQLDRYKNPQDRTGPLMWRAPVYAGGRLIVAGTDGRVLDIDPATGATLRTWDMGETPATPPIVARETLYTLDHRGTLTAWK